MVMLLSEMSSCSVGMEAPSLVHTGLAGFLFPQGLSELSLQNLEYMRGQTGSFRQMQTCVSKICFLHSRAAAEISIDGLPDLDRQARARARRCLLHIFAGLRRPRTVQFQWEGIVRELRGVETQVCRPPSAAGCAPGKMTPAKTLWRQH
jgi:hypothetical protein